MAKEQELVVLDQGAPVAEGEEHAEVRRQVLALRDRSDEDAWALSEALVQVHRGGYYHGWGFTSWIEYVEQEVDIHRRKAQFLVKIQEWIVTLPKPIQAWVRSLGWTKARMLVGIVTPENAADWKARIGKDCTVAALDEMLHSAAEEAAADPDGVGADVGSERQKPYSLGRPTPAQRANMDRAAERAARAANRDTAKDNLAYLWDLIATEYLATNHGIKTVQEYLGQVERVVGLRLVAYDVKSDEVVFGGELLDSLSGDEGDDGGDGEDAENLDRPAALAH